MRAASSLSARRVGRLIVTAAVVIGPMLLTACAEKAAAFFAGIGVTGDITVAVSGIPNGTNVQLLGNGIDQTQLADAPVTFMDVPFGMYGLNLVNIPAGYRCEEPHLDVTLSSSQPHVDASFSCHQLPGQISFGVTGLLGSTTAMVNYTGPENGSVSVGSASSSDVTVTAGTYMVNIVDPTNYSCSGNATITVQPDATVSAQFQCAQLPGVLSVTVLGATATVAYSGPMSGSASVDGTPVAFGNLTPATYTLTITNPPNMDCTPHTTTASVPANDTARVEFECHTAVGIVTVTVTGATAQVDFTGPQTGGTAVTGTHEFTNLLAGTYTFTITDPANYSCNPPSHDVVLAAGDSVHIVFDCSPAMVQPLTVGVDLSNLLGAPGAVPPGDYTRNVLDGATVAGTIKLTTLGTDFWSDFPDRVGSAANSGWRLDVGFKVYNQDFNVTGFAACPINVSLSALHYVTFTYRDASLNVLGQDQITNTACNWSTVPSGTRYIDFFAPDDRSADFTNIQLGR
jgi:hypothetical protein